MKKLLVIPIMLMYYLLMLIAFPIQIVLIIVNRFAEWLSNITSDLSIYYEDYCMKPFAKIHAYALDIIKSDKNLQQKNQDYNRIKQEKYDIQ